MGSKTSWFEAIKRYGCLLPYDLLEALICNPNCSDEHEAQLGPESMLSICRLRDLRSGTNSL
jgi:hypothetical protein